MQRFFFGGGRNSNVAISHCKRFGSAELCCYWAWTKCDIIRTFDMTRNLSFLTKTIKFVNHKNVCRCNVSHSGHSLKASYFYDSPFEFCRLIFLRVACVIYDAFDLVSCWKLNRNYLWYSSLPDLWLHNKIRIKHFIFELTGITGLVAGWIWVKKYVLVLWTVIILNVAVLVLTHWP